MAVLIPQPFIERVLLSSIVIGGIIVVFFFRYINRWFISKYGEMSSQLFMIILGMVLITIIMHLKVYPGHFSISQMASLVIGCVASFSLFIYFYYAKKVIDLEVIPVITKKAYLFVSVGRIIPFFLLAGQNNDPFFLSIFLYIFDAMMPIISILVGWTMLEISLPKFKYRPFDLYALKKFCDTIKNLCWNYSRVLVCQGDLESLETQVRPVERVIVLKMRGISQTADMTAVRVEGK